MYTKLFTKILDSSIWLEDLPTRICWITLLAVRDEDGFAQFSAPGNLASRARITLQEAEAAIKILESPDVNSNDQENEGRRIERVPGGWMILNAKKYDKIFKRENAKELNRNRVAEFRLKKNGGEKVKDGKPEENATEKTENYTPAIKNSEPKELIIPENLSTDKFKDLWKDWEKHRRKKGGIKDYKSLFARQLKTLSEWGHDKACAALQSALLGGWTGLFEPKENNNNKSFQTSSAPAINSVAQADSVIKTCQSEIEKLRSDSKNFIFDGGIRKGWKPEVREKYLILKARMNELVKMKIGTIYVP